MINNQNKLLKICKTNPKDWVVKKFKFTDKQMKKQLLRLSKGF